MLQGGFCLDKVKSDFLKLLLKKGVAANSGENQAFNPVKSNVRGEFEPAFELRREIADYLPHVVLIRLKHLFHHPENRKKFQASAF